MKNVISLNPRFDGAFLNFVENQFNPQIICLNPRFDGAFLNSKSFAPSITFECLNPRFDGAFLNLIIHCDAASLDKVLIPDLMGLF